MTDANVTRLINNAIIRLPGATIPVLQQELFMVMNDFFQNSNLWNEDIELTIPGGDPAGTVYVLQPTQPGSINLLLWTFAKPTNPNSARGSQIDAAMPTPGELVLRNQPANTQTIIATVALTVNDPTARDGYVQFPMWVLNKYNDPILSGLLSRMMSHPGRPYSNAQLSIFHGREYSSGVAQARVDWTRNQTYRQQAWRFPGFTRGSQKGRSSNWAPPQ